MHKNHLIKILCITGWLSHVVLAFYLVNYAKFQAGEWRHLSPLADMVFGSLFVLSFVPAMFDGNSIEQKIRSAIKALGKSILVLFGVLLVTVVAIAVHHAILPMRRGVQQRYEMKSQAGANE